MYYEWWTHNNLRRDALATKPVFWSLNRLLQAFRNFIHIRRATQQTQFEKNANKTTTAPKWLHRSKYDDNDKKETHKKNSTLIAKQKYSCVGHLFPFIWNWMANDKHQRQEIHSHTKSNTRTHRHTNKTNTLFFLFHFVLRNLIGAKRWKWKQKPTK